MKKVMYVTTVVLTLVVAATACAKKKGTENMNKVRNEKVLVAYYSATGTTEGVAKMIATATGGELYAIRPKAPYTATDLDWTVKTSRSTVENGNEQARPAIVKDKANLDAYESIYLGFPNWWNKAPKVIYTFIDTYGLRGKRVIPFMTSGGSGIENSVKILSKLYPDVKWQPGRLLNGATQKDIDRWVAAQ